MNATTNPTRPKPVLVTGASGCVGGSLALRLCREGVPVRALVRPSAKVDHLRGAGAELVEGDIRSPDAVAHASAGVDVIYHLAGVFRTASHPDQYYFDVNAGGTANVLAAAKRHGVARLVHGSTIGVHGDVLQIPCTENSPFNPGDVYQRSKLEGERLVQEAIVAGLPAVVYRSASVYGPGDLRHLKLFRSIQKRRFWMFGDGTTLWHPVYIDDLIDGIRLCGEHPVALGRIYVLAGPHHTRLNELVAGIAGALELSPPRGRLPFWPLYATATVCESLCRSLGIEPPLYRRRVKFFVNNRAFSIERAQRELGYAPRVDIGEGITRTIAWYREQGYLD